MPEREELLTVEEVAEYLKVNPQTVRNWIDRAHLRAVRIGARRVRYSTVGVRGLHRCR